VGSETTGPVMLSSHARSSAAGPCDFIRSCDGGSTGIRSRLVIIVTDRDGCELCSIVIGITMGGLAGFLATVTSLFDRPSFIRPAAKGWMSWPTINKVPGAVLGMSWP
jgi:hypothetical protein